MTQVILLRGMPFRQAPHEVPRGQCIAGQPVRAPHGPYPPDLPRESLNRTFLSTPYTRPPSAFRKWAYPRAVAAMLHGRVDVSTRWRIYPDKSSRTIQPSDAKIGSISSSVRAGAKKFQRLANGWVDAMGMPQCGFDLLDNSVRSAWCEGSSEQNNSRRHLRKLALISVPTIARCQKAAQ